MVVQKFHNARTSLIAMKPENEGKVAMIPITSSLYVPGRLQRTDTVLVDVGGQFLVEKSIPEANDYYDRRIKEVQANIAELQGVLTNKARLRDGAEFALEQKKQMMMRSGMAGH